jgi:hypothetical protein
LFTHSTWNLRQFAIMPARCPVCLVPYEPEPGFYWGAMFISYALNVAVIVTISLLLYFLAGNPPAWQYGSAAAWAVVVLTPAVLRYSRALMLYWFGGRRYVYEPRWRLIKESQL